MILRVISNLNDSMIYRAPCGLAVVSDSSIILMSHTFFFWLFFFNKVDILFFYVLSFTSLLDCKHPLEIKQGACREDDVWYWVAGWTLRWENQMVRHTDDGNFISQRHTPETPKWQGIWSLQVLSVWLVAFTSYFKCLYAKQTSTTCSTQSSVLSPFSASYL